ncbi:MAG: hypothetical protein A4S09_09630 [Proteobacteria bacterium SG_bin7]|nr:MAG: hypothetical protein A4S09_09630 [Proteobacteria bacterium SG_bin7]
MKVWWAPYELTFRESKKARNGALLRFEFKDIGFGYADLFPWPEFRDEDLKTQINNLRLGRLSPLLERSVAFAKEDAIARSEKRSLFYGLVSKIARSHYLFMSPEIEMEELEKIVGDGFNTIKIKLENGVHWINKLKNHQLSKNLKIRLDFNNKLTENEYIKFLEQLDSSARNLIEFVEDPTPFENSSWIKFNNAIPLALDCGSDKNFSEFEHLGFKYLILKPARQSLETINLPDGIKPVIMGYLDHPVGQSFAALSSARWRGEKLEAGICYHTCYRTNAYSERLKIKNAALVPDDGIGIGFGELLEKEKWEFLHGN